MFEVSWVMAMLTLDESDDSVSKKVKIIVMFTLENRKSWVRIAHFLLHSLEEPI